MIPEAAKLRVMQSKTPEERLAAAIVQFRFKFRAENNREPDFADYRDALRDVFWRDIALARLDEIKRYRAERADDRKAELALAVIACEERLGWDVT